MTYLNVNTDKVVAFANKLEKLHRSDFPVAVRKTLNDVALDAKRTELLKSANKAFTMRRSDGFFKRFSGVKFAKGFDLNSMYSEMGIAPGSGQGSIAARNLEKQELGGKVGKRSFIPLDGARTGSSDSRRVKKANYSDNLDYIDNDKAKQGDLSVASAFVAKKQKRPVRIGNNIARVKTVKSSGRGRNAKMIIRTTNIYSYRKNRSVKLKRRPFVGPAAMKSAKKWKICSSRMLNCDLKKP